jgi:hypothetical protein
MRKEEWVYLVNAFASTTTHATDLTIYRYLEGYILPTHNYDTHYIRRNVSSLRLIPHQVGVKHEPTRLPQLIHQLPLLCLECLDAPHLTLHPC